MWIVLCMLALTWANCVDIEVVVEGSVPALRMTTGFEMPRIGFGTAGLGVNTGQAVATALQLGYRLFDSAQAEEWYDERAVAGALATSGREKLFITTKLHPRHHGFESTKKRVEISLEMFQTTYLDAVLLHFPECWTELCGMQIHPEGTWRDSWRALEELMASGKVRTIGVSNFRIDQLKELQKMAILPHIVQDWMDPLHQARELRSFAQQIGAIFVAYSPLGTQWTQRGHVDNPVLSNPILLEIAQGHKVSVAQIVIAFCLSFNGTAVIPRSRVREHMQDNLRALQVLLSAGEVARIAALDGT